jgi:hypothetical protein
MHHRNIFGEHVLLDAPHNTFLHIRVFLVVSGRRESPLTLLPVTLEDESPPPQFAMQPLIGDILWWRRGEQGWRGRRRLGLLPSRPSREQHRANCHGDSEPSYYQGV